MTKIELYNAKNSSNALENGMQIEVKSVGTFPEHDKDGNEVTATALVATDGTVYTAISKTIADSIELLDEILQENGTVTIEVIAKKSNNGREFKQLQIIE